MIGRRGDLNLVNGEAVIAGQDPVTVNVKSVAGGPTVAIVSTEIVQGRGIAITRATGTGLIGKGRAKAIGIVRGITAAAVAAGIRFCYDHGSKKTKKRCEDCIKKKLEWLIYIFFLLQKVLLFF